MTLQILLFDDEEQRTEEWQQGLTALLDDADVVRLSSDDLRDQLEALEGRRQAAREGSEQRLAGTRFDEADVLVVDYDLFDLHTRYVVTGETVAYLARCFSACGLIVGVNQDATERHFDLTLKDHPASYADVSIGSAHLLNSGLWSHTAEVFRPWAWPIVPEAVRDYAACVDAVSSLEPDSDVLEILGLTELRSRLPRDVGEWLQPRGGGEAPPLFNAVLYESRIGLRPKEQLAHPDSAPRVLAARLRKWLETLVVPRQDVLVDAPHLALRFPGLIAASPAEWSSWNETATLHAPHSAVGLRADAIGPYAVQSHGWTSRPVWSWPGLASDASLDGFQDLPQEAIDSAVFGEDTSRFHPSAECRRFVAEVGGPLAQRWVRMPTSEGGDPAASYAPAVRFAL